MSLDIERRYTVRWHYKDEPNSSTRVREFNTLSEAEWYYHTRLNVIESGPRIAASLWETTKVASK